MQLVICAQIPIQPFLDKYRLESGIAEGDAAGKNTRYDARGDLG